MGSILVLIIVIITLGIVLISERDVFKRYKQNHYWYRSIRNYVSFVIIEVLLIIFLILEIIKVI